jgi:hypothetical protein
MTLLRRRSVFAAKTEATIGTAETLTAAEGVYNARDFMIQPNIPMTRREGQGGFNYYESVPEGMQGTCTITHDLTYDGTNVPTWASVLLPACGFVDTAGVFSPVSRGPGGAGLPKTLTLGHYHDGKRRILSGCMGSFVITCPTGKGGHDRLHLQREILRKRNRCNATCSDVSHRARVAIRRRNHTWNSVALCTSTVSVDAGNTVIMREKAESGNRTGFVSALVTNRAPIITADPEAVLVATQDRDAQWTAMTTAAWALTLNGSGTSTVVIDAPAAQIENKQQGNRNDLITDDLTWLATEDTTPDGELTITFNATP